MKKYNLMFNKPNDSLMFELLASSPSIITIKSLKKDYLQRYPHSKPKDVYIMEKKE